MKKILFILLLASSPSWARLIDASQPGGGGVVASTVATSAPLSGTGRSGDPVTLPTTADVTIRSLTTTGSVSVGYGVVAATAATTGSVVIGNTSGNANSMLTVYKASGLSQILLTQNNTETAGVKMYWNASAGDGGFQGGDASGYKLLSFNPNGGNLNFGGGNIYVDRTNARVGIGTTSPSVKLDVNGAIKASSTTFNGVAYNWPLASASGSLTNDGSGNLSWASASVATDATLASGTLSVYSSTFATLTSGITLTAGTDKPYQFLNANGANRIITLSSVVASTGAFFFIQNTEAAGEPRYNLDVRNESGTTLDILSDGKNARFYFRNGVWQTEYDHSQGVLIGAKVYSDQGYAGGYVGIGNDMNIADRSVVLGYGNTKTAWNISNYTGIGFATNNSDFTNAQGYYANAAVMGSQVHGNQATSTRTGEAVVSYRSRESYMNANESDDQWYGDTANNTPLEIFVSNKANNRYTIKAKSTLVFHIICSARDDVANLGAAYTLTGAIGQDGSGNTALIGTVTKAVWEDAGASTWDVNATADDTNEALIITVTGSATNPTRFQCTSFGGEVWY